MWRWGIAVIPVALVVTPASAAPRAQAGGHDTLVAKHAAANGVPESLVRRVIHIESRGNPRVVSKGNYGLMQIRLGTARAMGYNGTAAGLLDADTNMTYAVKYLAGAYRVAGGNQHRAIAYYQRGYYMQAKTKGFPPYSRTTQTAQRQEPESAVQQVAKREFEPQRFAAAAPKGGDVAPLPVRTVTTEVIRKPKTAADPPRSAAAPAASAPAAAEDRAPIAFAARFDAIPVRAANDLAAERKLQTVEVTPPPPQPQLRPAMIGSAAAAERKLQDRAPGAGDSARQQSGFQLAARSEPQQATTSVGQGDRKPVSSEIVNVPMPQMRPQIPAPAVAEVPTDRAAVQQVAALPEPHIPATRDANRKPASNEMANMPMPQARPQVPAAVEEPVRQTTPQVAARAEPPIATGAGADRQPQVKPAERVKAEPAPQSRRQRSNSRTPERSLVAGVQSDATPAQQAETPRTRRTTRTTRRSSSPTNLLAFLKKAITPETRRRR